MKNVLIIYVQLFSLTINTSCSLGIRHFSRFINYNDIKE